MSLFNRQPQTIVAPEILSSLAAYGAAVLAARATGQQVTDPRFSWETFLNPVGQAMMFGDRDAVIQELYEHAINAPDRSLAVVGAYCLLADFNPEMEKRRYLQLFDEALEQMRVAGLSSAHLTVFERRRWVTVHGELPSSFDGLFEVQVPNAEELPPPEPLEEGASRMLALLAPLPKGNAFFAEHGTGGTYRVYSESQRSRLDTSRARFDEERLGTFSSLEDLLRALGEMLGTPTYWYADELEPYFPQRRA